MFRCNVKLPSLHALLVVLLCLCTYLESTAETTPLQGKEISISVKKSSLSNVLYEISKKSGITIYFVNEDLSMYKDITYEAKNQEVKDILNDLLKGKDLQYEVISEKQIGIRKVKVRALSTEELRDTLLTISGKVTDENGNPVVGATVVLKGNSQLGTTTNSGGMFMLDGVKANASVIISSISFLTKEEPVKGRLNLGNINLQEYVNELDVVQIQAYGTTSKRYSTSNIVSIKESDIQRQPISNPLLALQGRVAGLLITPANGLSGSGITVRIQGDNSFFKGNDPFYVIDGVPFSSQMLPTVGGGPLGNSGGADLGNGLPLGGNPLSYINPSDIESIEVLKDADATAIYGSRAANGAILITTKRGKQGDTRVSVNVYQGWGRSSRKMRLLNTEQYLEMRREAFKNDNKVPSSDPTDPGYAPDLTIYDQKKYTDWQKILTGGTAHRDFANVSLSGGSSNTQYIVGGTYSRETPVFSKDFKDVKISAHFNLTTASLSQRLKFSLTTNYMIDNNELPQTDLTYLSTVLVPNAPNLYNSDGTLNWQPNSNGSSTWTNPISELLKRYKNTTKNLITNGVISYQLLPDLQFKANLGYTDLQTEEFSATPLVVFKPERRATEIRSASLTSSLTNTWIVEPQVSYEKQIRDSRLEVLLGGTLQQTKNTGQQLAGLDYPNDEVLEDIKSANDVIIGMTIASVYKYSALFGRLNYKVKNRYIINLVARRDGSSRFGRENMLHNFGSIGVGWIFTEENFMRKLAPTISFGKLRLSYGTTGNDQIGEYQTLNLYQINTVFVPYQGVNGLSTSSIPNPYLQWEMTKKLNFGLDVGLFKDRLLLNLNYADNRSSNQLMAYNLPMITGVSSIVSNFPATVKNSSFEVSMSGTPIKGKSLNYEANINFTLPKNKLIAFPGLENTGYRNFYTIGEPVRGLVRVFKFAGVNPTTGVYEFFDSKGNKTSRPSSADDKVVSINVSPRFYIGTQHTFTYKGIELSMQMQFTKQVAKNYRFGTSGVFNPGYYINSSAVGNHPVSVLNRWKREGDNANVQKYSTTLTNNSPFSSANNSDAQYSDASYLRLRNVSLSYMLPRQFCSKLKLQAASIYLQGQNIFVITKFNGFDPENTSYGSVPSLRMLTAGLKITL